MVPAADPPARHIALLRAVSVGFLEAALDADAERALIALKTPDDAFRLQGRELHWLSRVGQNESKLTNARIEKAITAKITFRGVNTVRKLAAKVAPKLHFCE